MKPPLELPIFKPKNPR